MKSRNEAADEGDFSAYIQAQGGPPVPRRNQQTLHVAYQTNDQLNTYDEEVQKVVDIYVQLNPSADITKTRCRKYRLIKKVADSEDEELLKSVIGVPRSSGNNCRNGGDMGEERAGVNIKYSLIKTKNTISNDDKIANCNKIMHNKNTT
ncbi:hypothetical protein [Arsenophonus endosymbiont of Aleurodicus floccissimus]|uniref:hypothetical protein n=1 Tax=Arsenophonus endosymbiont of Aleurodicus floccissimus TaxID=2152761 RepID=UPI0015FFDDC9|nr:hypothetical protein [Arsenophonus endosymbiont of Aleurodicus floccissimus]